ncbi:MAG: glycosyltransferase [Xanthomonadales bacterium]|nr:glycosyltransferase [Xanthomonadales bacterium]
MQNLRQILGKHLNQAATKNDLVTIRALAQHRHTAILKLINKNRRIRTDLPCIDLVLVASNDIKSFVISLRTIKKQSYPSEKITLTILLLGNQQISAMPLLPVNTFKAQYIKLTEENSTAAFFQTIENLSAPYFLLMQQPFELAEHCLEICAQNCIASDTDTGLWELSPSLSKRVTFYDPVTLEVPSSDLELGIIRRQSYLAIGGFNPQLPLSQQGYDLGFRLRSRGHRLKNIGQSELYQSSRVSNNNLIQSSRLHSQETDFGMGSCLKLSTVLPQKDTKVSIVMRTYAGRSAWLHESICSVLNQTHPNIELIIIEDGSNEHSVLINQLLPALNPGQSIKYLSQRKLGKAHAGNLGLENATGNYIGFLDDDDLLFANHVELLLGTALANKQASGAYALAWEVRTATPPGMPYAEHHYEVPAISRQPYSRETLLKHNLWSIQSVLFEKSLYDQFGGFDVNCEYLEDWELWLRYTQTSHFAFLPHITSLYRTPADPYEFLSRVGNPERRALIE